MIINTTAVEFNKFRFHTKYEGHCSSQSALENKLSTVNFCALIKLDLLIIIH